MDSRELLKEFLMDFPSRLAKFEQSALETGLDMPISSAEIHIIDKIGIDGGQKMTVVARRLGVTQATLSVACDKLAGKGLISRVRAPHDKRVVELALTSQGLIAYSFHQALMDNVTEALTAGLSDEAMTSLGLKLSTLFQGLER